MDDEKPVRYTLRRLLEGAGHRVLEAGSSEQALSVVTDEVSDLVITDLKMPGADGLELARTLLEQDPARPVMLMTGYADVDSARRALQMGVYEYFTKPVDTDEVVTRVARALERRTLVLQNLAHQRDTERQLRERTAELERAHAERLRADRVKVLGEMAAAMGREVMNPLSVVQGRIDMVLMRGRTDEADHASLESARTSLDHAVRMLRALRNGSCGGFQDSLLATVRQALGDLTGGSCPGAKGGRQT